MILNPKTLEKLRNLINEETERRSGQKLVIFFNKFGFSDTYGPGFPSRWKYTDDRLEKITVLLNLTSVLRQCLHQLILLVITMSLINT
jgi:hypothetical protein